MWSVSSRRRLSSTARLIQRADPPAWLGSRLIGRPNLVASTTSSRWPLMAWPTTRSDWPRVYTSAVSIRLIPASSARRTIAAASSSLGPPWRPKFIAPKPSSLTSIPETPSVR